MLMEEGKMMKISSHCWWIVLANDEYKKHLLEYVQFDFTKLMQLDLRFACLIQFQGLY
jgi:hypothetical protein